MKELFLYKEIENKSIVWFKNQNQYLILENNAAYILKELNNKTPIIKIGEALAKKLAVPYEAAIDFIKNIETNLYRPNTTKEDDLKKGTENTTIPSKFSITKYYTINELVFKIDFESELEEYLIHPKFSHLSTAHQDAFHFHYKIFSKNDETTLIVDDKFIGTWHRKDIHYFQGKFLMELTQHIHQKEEKDWMGVFHASAVSNDKKSVLFLGDSGNGKSTSLALLQANGFTCLADDFVPMDATKKEVYSFPAAISIKKSSLETLLPIYPELKDAAEYNFKTLNKIVRFIPPNNSNFHAYLPCNDLVFIKYQKESPTVFNTISKLDAFQQLVPDSWISPIEQNAQQFLDWFENLNCYQLTYSTNSEMIATVAKIFNNDI